MLLKAGASQPACEDALLEASLFGEAEAVQLLMSSELARLDSAAHAIVTACSRGFVDVVAALIKVQGTYFLYLFVAPLLVYSY